MEHPFLRNVRSYGAHKTLVNRLGMMLRVMCPGVMVFLSP
jgi:hypothetical protein